MTARKGKTKPKVVETGAGNSDLTKSPMKEAGSAAGSSNSNRFRDSIVECVPAAVPGSGSTLLQAWFKSMVRIDMLDAYYKNPGAETPELPSGQVVFVFNFFSVT